jgi:hypothetical protein
VKVGDVVRWSLPDYFGSIATTQMGVIVKMAIGNGADVAWFGDDMRVTWVPLLELEVISESR